MLANKCSLFQKSAGGFGVVAAVQPLENWNFYPHLSLETVFPLLYLPQFFYKMNISSPNQHKNPVWKTMLLIWKQENFATV